MFLVNIKTRVKGHPGSKENIKLTEANCWSARRSGSPKWPGFCSGAAAQGGACASRAQVTSFGHACVLNPRQTPVDVPQFKRSFPKCERVQTSAVTATRKHRHCHRRLEAASPHACFSILYVSVAVIQVSIVFFSTLVLLVLLTWCILNPNSVIPLQC